MCWRGRQKGVGHSSDDFSRSRRALNRVRENRVGQRRHDTTDGLCRAALQRTADVAELKIQRSRRVQYLLACCRAGRSRPIQYAADGRDAASGNPLLS